MALDGLQTRGDLKRFIREDREREARSGKLLRTQSVTTGTVTAGAGLAVTLTWNQPFQSANYIPFAVVEDSTASASALRLHHVQSWDATQVVVRVFNDAGVDKTGTLHILAVST